jgi:formiminotetrahydrofolate cyclodeaminase
VTGLADRRVGDALAAMASRAKPPAAGVASALAAAAAAALVELTACLAADRMAAEDSDAPTGTAIRLRTLAHRAAELRERLLVAADDDARAYSRVMQAREGAARAGALEQAAEPPLAIAECAAEVAEAAAEIAGAGVWAFTADAVVARELAATAARSGAELVAVNLAAHRDDPRTARARAAAERAQLAGSQLQG